MKILSTLNARAASSVKTLKLSALLQLRKAVLEERYEDCLGYVSAAEKMGAKPGEIHKLLCHPADFDFEGE